MKKKICIEGTIGEWNWRDEFAEKVEVRGNIVDKYDIYFLKNHIDLDDDEEYMLEQQWNNQNFIRRSADIHIYVIANKDTVRMRHFVEATKLACTSKVPIIAMLLGDKYGFMRDSLVRNEDGSLKDIKDINGIDATSIYWMRNILTDMDVPFVYTLDQLVDFLAQ